MKKIVFVILLLFSVPALAQYITPHYRQGGYVRSYRKDDGTWVSGHYRKGTWVNGASSYNKKRLQTLPTNTLLEAKVSKIDSGVEPNRVIAPKYNSGGDPAVLAATAIVATIGIATALYMKNAKEELRRNVANNLMRMEKILMNKKL